MVQAGILLVICTSARKSAPFTDPIPIVNAYESARLTGVLSDEKNHGYGFCDPFLQMFVIPSQIVIVTGASMYALASFFFVYNLLCLYWEKNGPSVAI